VDCSHDHNLERSILCILKGCCPHPVKCTEAKKAAICPIVSPSHNLTRYFLPGAGVFMQAIPALVKLPTDALDPSSFAPSLPPLHIISFSGPLLGSILVSMDKASEIRTVLDGSLMSARYQSQMIPSPWPTFSRSFLHFCEVKRCSYHPRDEFEPHVCALPLQICFDQEYLVSVAYILQRIKPI